MTITTILSNLHILQRLRSLGTSSAKVEQKLEHLKKEATGTHTALSLRSHGGTPITQLVEFYRLVSPWCDKSAELYELERELALIDYGQHLKARQALVSLAAQEERNLYGVNQTSTGETPTTETTFLGGYRCCGLPTKTVAEWEAKRPEYSTELALINELDSPTIMAVIDARASELLNDGLDRWYKLLFNLIAS